MVKIKEAQFNVGLTNTPLPYVNVNGPNLQPIAQGLANAGEAFARVQLEQKQKTDTMQRYQALSSLTDFETTSKLRFQDEVDRAPPEDTGLAQRLIDNQIKYEQEFIRTLPPELQPEFQLRAHSIRGGLALSAHDTQDKRNTLFYEEDIKKGQNEALLQLNSNPDALEQKKLELDARIEASGLSRAQKDYAKQNNARILETASYGATLKRDKLQTAQYTNDLTTSAVQAARTLGISPVDLLTVISFETGGTFNAGIRGGKNNAHVGLIQFDAENQRKYGIYPGMPVGEQMTAVVRYLQDRGFKPGMSIYDLYSTINAGRPGMYNASDAANGGTPGTVRDKVDTQMADHRAKAEALLGGKFEVPSDIDTNPRFANVLYEDRIAMQNDAATAVNKELAAQAAERKLQHDIQYNELLNGLNDNRYGASDIEKAREEGWLTDYDEINKAQSIVEQQSKNAENLATFMTRIVRGDTLNPNDEANKKSMGELFKLDGGEAKIQAMDERYIEDNLGPLMRSTGMVPKDAVDLLGTMTTSSDGRRMIYAYKALNMLEEMNPDAYAVQVPEAIRAKADVYEVLKTYMTEPELLDRLRKNADPQQARAQAEMRELRKKELDSTSNKNINFQSVLESFGADQAEVGVRGMVMEDEWRTILLDYASQGLTLEDANKQAIKRISAKWGNDTIDGKTVLMRNPPSKLYPYMSNEEINRQLRGELGLTEDEQVQLVSDNRTEADVAAGRPASYIPMVYRDGVWTPVYRTPIPPSGAAQAMRDVRPETEKRVIQRIWFRPTPEDAAVRDVKDTIDNIDSKIKALGSVAFSPRTGGVPLPKAVEDQVKQLQEQKTELQKTYEAAKANADKQYMSPVLSAYTDAKKKLEQLNRESDFIYGPIEDWPKYQEWISTFDEVERLKVKLDQENEARRNAGRN